MKRIDNITSKTLKFHNVTYLNTPGNAIFIKAKLDAMQQYRIDGNEDTYYKTLDIAHEESLAIDIAYYKKLGLI